MDIDPAINLRSKSGIMMRIERPGDGPRMTLPTTLTAALDARSGDARQVHYIAGEGERREMSFGELRRTALGVLRHFQDSGLRAGDELIIFTANNEQFLDAFWACLYGGIVPVPVAVGISDDHRLKLLKIFRQLRRPFVYTETAQLNRLQEFAGATAHSTDFAALRERALVVESIRTLGGSGTVHAVQPQDVAFVQFSSGSTSEPKGVVLTHANIMANIAGIIECAGFTREDISLSWMPLTHDMGLIGFHLCMLVAGIEHTIMDTRLFSRRPLLWLKEASERRATLLSSPNFGYKHYLKLFESRGGDEELDLSAVRLIFNGAEPISVSLCERFLDSHGAFRAEAQRHVSRSTAWPRPASPSPSRRRARPTGRCAWTGAVSPSARRIRARTARCRRSAGTDAARPSRHRLRAAHLRRRGSTARRRARRPHSDPRRQCHGAATTAVRIADSFLADGWLRTGDLGFLRLDGELVVTGRHKELIFSNGENCYPHDLENIAETGAGIELGKVAVAGARRGSRRRGRAAGVPDRPRLACRFRPTRQPGPAQDHRADRTAGRPCHARARHPQDHQRQDPAHGAGAKLRERRVRRRDPRTRRPAPRAPRSGAGERSAICSWCCRRSSPP